MGNMSNSNNNIFNRFGGKDDLVLEANLQKNKIKLKGNYGPKIRLSRGGSKNKPYYRIVVAESFSPRDGKFVERIIHITQWLMQIMKIK